MEVFVAFIENNVPLVVFTAIAVVGIIGVSAALIALKIKNKISKKTVNAQEDVKPE